MTLAEMAMWVLERAQSLGLSAFNRYGEPLPWRDAAAPLPAALQQAMAGAFLDMFPEGADMVADPVEPKTGRHGAHMH